MLAVATDVSKPGDVDALAERTLARFGKVHVLCNNAGVSVGGPMWSSTLDDWRWVLGVNLWGVIHGVRTFVPIMIRQGEPAHVVNTASLAGLVVEPVPRRLQRDQARRGDALGDARAGARDRGRAGQRLRAVSGFVQTQIADSSRNRPPDLADSAEPSRGPRPSSQMVRAADRGGHAGRATSVALVRGGDPRGAVLHPAASRAHRRRGAPRAWRTSSKDRTPEPTALPPPSSR